MFWNQGGYYDVKPASAYLDGKTAPSYTWTSFPNAESRSVMEHSLAFTVIPREDQQSVPLAVDISYSINGQSFTDHSPWTYRDRIALNPVAQTVEQGEGRKPCCRRFCSRRRGGFDLRRTDAHRHRCGKRV
jgi:hypothetical protein